MTRSEELQIELVCLRFAADDFAECHRFASTAAGTTDDDIKFPVIAASIVSYVRPFTVCRVKGLKAQRPLVQIGDIETTPDQAALHAELVAYRHRFVAHTDLSARDLKLANASSDKIGPWFMMSYRSAGIETWNAKLDGIRELATHCERTVSEKRDLVMTELHDLLKGE